MLPLLLLVADVDAMIAVAKRITAAERHCDTSSGSEITVCGRSAADAYRVPFVGYDPGDRRAESVSGERHRLLNATDACQEKRAIMVGCGHVGVQMAVGSGGTTLTARKLAP